MATPARDRAPDPPAPRLRSSVSAGRRFRNGLALCAICASLVLVLIPLALVLWTVLKRGLPLFNLSFFTQPIPPPIQPGPGLGPAVVGTIVITLGAAVLAVPLGILGAVYVVEYGASNWLGSVVRFLGDVMAGVPSVVMGLFIFTIYTLRFGLQGFGGSLALACLMLPVVIRSTDSMLRLVPQDLREASQALGASRSRTTLTVVLPAALPGITSGALLAVARAAGETAPLLFTIGIVTSTNWRLFSGPNTTLSQQIFLLSTESAYPGAQQRAWTAALTLILLVLLLTIASRVVVRRFSIRTSGG